MSTYYPQKNALLDFLFRGQEYPTPTGWYVGLLLEPPGVSDPGVEVVGGSYGRILVQSNLNNWSGTQGAGTTAISSGTSGVISNNFTIQFVQPTADWGTVAYFGLYSAISGDNLKHYGALTVSRTIYNGDVAPKFTAGDLQIII